MKVLYDVFGKTNVKFSSKYFSDLIRSKNWLVNDQFLTLVRVNLLGKRYKYVVDFNDPPTVIKSMSELKYGSI